MYGNIDGYDYPVSEWIVVLSTILLPYLGFVVFIYKVWNVGRHIVEEMRQSYEKEENACVEIANEIDSYSKLESISVKISTPNNVGQVMQVTLSTVNKNDTHKRPNQPRYPNSRRKKHRKNGSS